MSTKKLILSINGTCFDDLAEASNFIPNGSTEITLDGKVELNHKKVLSGIMPWSKNAFLDRKTQIIGDKEVITSLSLKRINCTKSDVLNELLETMIELINVEQGGL